MSVVPVPAQQAFQQISTTVAQVSQNVVPPAAAPAPSSLTAADSAPAATAMAQNGTPAYAVGAQPSTPTQTAASPFQQMLFTILQQLASSLASKLAGSPGEPTQTQYQAYSNVSPQNIGNASSQQSPYGAPPYGASPKAQSSSAQYAPPSYPNQAPASSSSLANAIWLGPEDLKVDTTNAFNGQPVHITGQIHNGSTDQDPSGLTVQLVEPSNASPSNQAIQSGVTVPRSGVTPVQLSWIPSQSSAGQVQLVLQVLDANGLQIANAAVPAITVANTFSGGGAGSTPNPNMPSSSSFVAPPSQAAAIEPAQGANSPGVQATAPGGQSTAPPLQAVPVRPQITYFGVTDTSSSATTAQIPPLSLQIANPSDTLLPPTQAQLFVDGATQQVQSLGPLLPKQTRSAVFAAMPAPSGPHALQVVVTTADGATTAAASSANVAPPTSSNTTKSTGVLSSGGNNVRVGIPTTFTIAAVTQSTTVSQRPATVITPSSAIQPVQPASTSPVAATSASIAPASRAGPAATANPSITNLPTRSWPTGAPGNIASSSTGAPTRTITPGSAPGALPIGAGIPARPGPAVRATAPRPGPGPTVGTRSCPGASHTKVTGAP